MNAADITMGELLAEFPWARRTLFQRFHIGGCSSCGFSEDETLAQICQRNKIFTPEEILSAVKEAHEADEALMINPQQLRNSLDCFCLVDIRTRPEFDAVHIPGSLHFNQDLLKDMLTNWPKDRPIVIIDHTGTRSLDAAAYFAGQGFSNVSCLRGGIDAYSQLADPSLPRYTIE